MNQGNDKGSNKILAGLAENEAESGDTLGAIAQAISTFSQTCAGDSLKLLALLRLLESLHQEIRETLFQSSLPDSRQALYSLLRDIENSGGWPYIHRMRLQDLLQNLVIDPTLPEPLADPDSHPTPPTLPPQ
jgi:hypothetical protein